MPIAAEAPPLAPQPAGERIAIRSMGLTLVVGADAAVGAMTMLEATLVPRSIAMPLHTHARETETCYVLEGVLTVQVGERIVTAGPGQAVVRPAGVPHTYWNAGDDPVRFLDVIAPGGLEEWYREVAARLADPRRPDVAGILAASERHGLRFDMDSLLDLVGRHAVSLA